MSSSPWNAGLRIGLLSGILALSSSAVPSAAIALQSAGHNLKQTTNPTPSVTSGTRFSCQMQNGQYTVMYAPESQPGQFYPWATPTELGGGWTPERRCTEISRRLETYRPDGLLEMQTGVENGYNTVCVTTQQVSGCRIVLTVPPGQDPLATRDRVFENLAVADSGQRTDAVTTFTGGNDDLLDRLGNVLGLPTGQSPRRSSDSINLRPFLDRADGGTGAQLQRNRLSPNRFR